MVTDSTSKRASPRHRTQRNLADYNLSESYFSETYREARKRFLKAAQTVGATVDTHPLPLTSEPGLAVDVAIVEQDTSSAQSRTIVISSGVHGVEGFFGSAIQLALLEQLCAASSRPDVRYVLIHAVNPFGFAKLRRFNEDNVDLNRNFLLHNDEYAGAPDGYAKLNKLLNPQSPPSRFEPFRLRAMWNIWRVGLQAVKASVAGGQYEYPHGLFFGGHGPCWSTRVLQANCESWISSSSDVVHIDFHSGLGEFGQYKLLLAEPENSPSVPWYVETFGAKAVEPLTQKAGTAYTVSGPFGEWMQQHFHSLRYRFVAAEFGTYDVVRVLASLRAENRAHHYGLPTSSAYWTAKQELLECFCPRSKRWRELVVASGLNIIEKAT